MIELITVAKTFKQKPSSMLHGLSSYEAYCFDVACTVYMMEMEKGNRPVLQHEDASNWL